MTQIRTARKGLQQKYLVYLVNLRDQIQKDPFIAVSKVASDHRCPFDLVPALVDLGIIEGSWSSGRHWIGDEPTYQMVDKMRRQAKENRTGKKQKPEDLYYGKPRDLFEKENPEAIRVGSGYIHKTEKVRRWRSIFTGSIFNLKFKIYKLK
tara:strand:+ start:429 stop:881 length:453 start_codon:yes stop_codon:yes gene_type:complete